MKSSSKLKIIVSALCLLSASHAYSVGSVNGKITKIRVDNPSGPVMVYFDTNITGTPPSCVHSAYTSVLAIDSTTADGKSALMAKASQANVTAYGKGRCGVYGDSLTEILDNLIVM